MKRKKLQELQELLKLKETKSHFDLSTWMNDEMVKTLQEGHLFNQINAQTEGINFDCGMSACVGGWATNIIKELVYDANRDQLVNLKTESEDFSAFADAFGITEGEAMFICDPDMYFVYKDGMKNPKFAIQHIQMVLDGDIDGRNVEDHF